MNQHAITLFTTAGALVALAAPAAAAAAKPDLRTAAVTHAATPVAPGSSLALRATIANRGTAPARRSTTFVLISRDERRSRDDARLAKLRTRRLAARKRVALRTTLTLPGAIVPGGYHVIACADGAKRVRERREGNNCRAAGTLSVQASGAAGTGPASTGPAPAPVTAPAAGSCAAAADVPDLAFTDSDCDGIDGAAAKSIFVSPLGQDEFAGTRSRPKRSLGAAITAAGAAGLDAVLVANGSYSGHAALLDGVSVYGGYDPDTWQRTRAEAAVIHGGGAGLTAVGLGAHGIASPTHVQLLTIKAPTPGIPAASSYGMHVTNSPGLRVEESIVQAGNGTNGSAGAAGIKGIDGGDGSKGGAGACDSDYADNDGGAGGASLLGNVGGEGGDGGENEVGGAWGKFGLVNGGAGGPGGNPGTTGKVGQPGTKGENGINGGGGAPGLPGTLSGGTWTAHAAGDGQDASHGRGGGGGGGGGSQTGDWVVDGAGNGGGGGGGGGTGGIGGEGGGGGGASFGIFAVGSQGMTITGSQVSAGNGGNGGAGGGGGAGGAGGKGGPGGDTCTGEVGGGGLGGVGGAGGHGGAGGGGAGGLSAALYGDGNVLVTQATTLTTGKGGAGGYGAANNSGPAGIAGLRLGA